MSTAFWGPLSWISNHHPLPNLSLVKLANICESYFLSLSSLFQAVGCLPFILHLSWHHAAFQHTFLTCWHFQPGHWFHPECNSHRQPPAESWLAGCVTPWLPVNLWVLLESPYLLHLPCPWAIPVSLHAQVALLSPGGTVLFPDLPLLLWSRAHFLLGNDISVWSPPILLCLITQVTGRGDNKRPLRSWNSHKDMLNHKLSPCSFCPSC